MRKIIAWIIVVSVTGLVTVFVGHLIAERREAMLMVIGTFVTIAAVSWAIVVLWPWNPEK